MGGQQMNRTGSATELTQTSGYSQIKENMREMVCNAQKPALYKKEEFEPLKFHNTLSYKYDTEIQPKLRMVAPKGYDYQKSTHRSSPTEVKFINSMYFRKDHECLNPHPYMKRPF